MNTVHLTPVVMWLALASCVATQERNPEHASSVALDDAIGGIADNLLEAAEVRADISAMRVCLHEFQGNDVERVYGHWAKQQGASLATARAALEHEFMVSLSSRVHLLDSELAGVGAPRLPQHSIGEVAGSLDATHALVGSFVRREDELLVSVRLVDAESLLIVAAARGNVPYAPLIDRGALAWNYPGEQEQRPMYPADTFTGSVAAAPQANVWPQKAPVTPKVIPVTEESVKVSKVAKPVAKKPNKKKPTKKTAAKPDANVPLERVDGPAAMRLRTYRPNSDG